MASFSTTRQFKYHFTFAWKDGEKEHSEPCWVVFNMMPQDDLEAAYEKAIEDTKNKTANQALLSVIVASFGGLDMQDANGKTLPTSLQTEAAIRDPVLSSVLMVEWNQGRAGVAGLGNSIPKT